MKIQMENTLFFDALVELLRSSARPPTVPVFPVMMLVQGVGTEGCPSRGRAGWTLFVPSQPQVRGCSTYSKVSSAYTG